jgi:hypothetical protein
LNVDVVIVRAILEIKDQVAKVIGLFYTNKVLRDRIGQRENLITGHLTIY